MATNTTEKYSRLIILLAKGCTKLVRALAVKQIDKSTPGGHNPDPWTIDQFLEFHKDKKCNRKFNSKQKMLLSPETDIQQWDLQLICIILIEYCSVTTVMKMDIEKLMKLRNKLCHKGDPVIANDDFALHMEQLKVIINRLLLAINNNDLGREMEMLVQHVEHGALCLDDTIKVLKSWYDKEQDIEDQLELLSQRQEDMTNKIKTVNKRQIAGNSKLDNLVEGHRETTNQIETLSRGQEETNKDIGVLKSDMTLVLTRMEYLLSIQRLGITMPDANVQLSINNCTDEQERNLSEQLLKLLDPKLRQHISEENISGETLLAKIKDSVANAMNELLSGGDEVVSVTKKCVIIKLKCPSFQHLKDLWTKCIKGELTKLFQPVQNAVREIDGFENVEVSVFVMETEFWRCMDILVSEVARVAGLEEMTEHAPDAEPSNAVVVSLLNPDKNDCHETDACSHLATLNTGAGLKITIKPDTFRQLVHIWHICKSGRLNKHMTKVSEALKEYYGLDDLNIIASIDEDKLLLDLKDCQTLANEQAFQMDVSKDVPADTKCSTTKSILLSDPPVAAQADFLKYFFENKRISGGADVVHVQVDEDNSNAIVEFVEPEAVEKVLGNRPIKMLGVAVDIEMYNPPPLSTVVVRGPQYLIDEDVLELYFENTKISDGGDIEMIEVDNDENIAYVTFATEEVAQRVVNKGTHIIHKKSISVQLHTPVKNKFQKSTDQLNSDDETKISKPQDTIDEEKGSDLKSKNKENDFEIASEELSLTVEVRNIPKNVSEQTLMFYFENHKRSGGGDIESINVENDVAYVTFEAEKAAEAVAKRCHRVAGHDLQVSIYKPYRVTKQTAVDDYTTATVLVKGLKPFEKMDTDRIKLYLENTKRSGGGNIVDFEYDDDDADVAFVTYENTEVAYGVASRDHCVEGVNLFVSLCKPQTQCPLNEGIFYEDRILVGGIYSSTSTDRLFNLLEAKLGTEPKHVIYGEKKGVVMVTFETPPDFKIIERISSYVRLDGSSITFTRISKSKCVKVMGVPKHTPKDTLEFYFENRRRSGGGPVETVVVQDDGSVLVYFENEEDVNSVLLKQNHKLYGQELHVKLYIECLGRTIGEETDTLFRTPDPLVITDTDPVVLKFILNSNRNRKFLENLLKDCYTEIVWPEVLQSCKITMKCMLSSDVIDHLELARHWKQKTEKTFHDFIKQITVVRTRVKNEVWQRVIDGIKIKDTDEIAVVINKEKEVITLVGYKRTVETVSVDLSKTIKDIEENEQQIQMVKEDISIAPVKSTMLKALHFPQKIEQKYKKTKVVIHPDKNKVSFEGTLTNVLGAKCDMYELIIGFVQSTVYDIPEMCVGMYHLKQVKEYIVNILKENNLIAVWEVIDRSLKVCSTSKDDHDKCVKLIKEAVVLKSIPVNAFSQLVIFSDLWQTKVDELQAKHTGRVLIMLATDFETIQVCTTDDIVMKTMDSLEQFLSLNTVYEESVKFPCSLTRLIDSHHNDKLHHISKDLTSYHVRITCGNQSSGFTLNGTEEGLIKAKSRLNILARKVLKRDHIIQKPGLGVQIQLSEGKDAINKVERSLHCVVEIQNKADESIRLLKAVKEEVQSIVDTPEIISKKRFIKNKAYFNEDAVKFTIFAMEETSIVEAMKKLDSCIDSMPYIRMFQDTAIANLKDNQKLEIEKLVDENRLQLKWDYKGIQISGGMKQIINAQDKIYRIIRDADMLEKEKTEAAKMSDLVQWNFIEIADMKQELIPYDNTLNLRIEMAYVNKERKFEFKDMDGNQYQLDFSSMTEYMVDNPDDSAIVIRRDKISESTCKFPPTWRDAKGNLNVITLHPKDKEYMDIASRFNKSSGSNFTVSKIERVQNRNLFQRYQRKKELMESQIKPSSQNERFLWYETTKESECYINNSGFNRSYCEKNDIAYGDGVYFNVKAAFSCHPIYSTSEVKRIYLCRVLTGFYTLGQCGMRVPPIRTSYSDSSVAYDSVVDNTHGPNMFIIFHDSQAYPEYILEFK